MNDPTSPVTPDLTFMTTKEVAELLRVKERKVYDLAAANEIPHRRITGKILFPKSELLAWIDGDGEPAPAERPAVITGSHDPLLDWAVRECGAGLATMLNGSLDGLDVFSSGQAAATGMHIPEAGGWNARTVSSRGLRNCVLISWAVRARGLLVAEPLQDSIKSIRDLQGKRVVLRQPGAGATALFDGLLTENGMAYEDMRPISSRARTEADAAAAVAAGEAEAALGIESMAQQFHLPFVPLMNERFDLLIDWKSYFTEPLQALMKFTQSATFHEKAAAMGGYDLKETGEVRWLAP